jgi:hypothetical protein
VTGGLALAVGWTLAALLLAVAIAAAFLAIRRLLLGRGGGTVECGLRHGSGDPWRLGLASYQPDELRWYSAFGLRLRPAEVFGRASLRLLERRPVGRAEAASFGPDVVVVVCQVGRAGGIPASAGVVARLPLTVELAMSDAALTGLLAWLEAAPPAQANGRR